MKQVQSWIIGVVGSLCACTLAAAEEIDYLNLDVISYEDFQKRDPVAIVTLRDALFEKGIVGIKGVPGYREKAERLIETARAFSQLPEAVKEAYAPHAEETFLGYERGKEKFQRPDGSWVTDDLKVSYYGFVPENPQNKWPVEIDLQTPFEDLGGVMHQMGLAVMQAIGLLDFQGKVDLEDVPRVGRMLYYRKSGDTVEANPYWCGAHYDHSLFTTLMPAYYFADGIQIEEPEEAGLFVRAHREDSFRKVVANDPDVLLFQVGEFAQLIANDAFQATEHRVHKASGNVERYTMALFCDAPMDFVVHSTSVKTEDPRYGGEAGDSCSYAHWTEETFKRFHAEKGGD